MNLAPLTPTQMILYPLLKLLARDQQRRVLDERRALTIERQKRHQQVLALRREILKEARLYRGIVVEALARMGYAWKEKRGADKATTEAGRGGGRRNRRKTWKVRIELTRSNEHAHFYKILVRRRTLFGSRNELPYKTYVSQLLSDETIEELSWATQRVVRAKRDDPRKGAWIIVYRNEGAGLIPNFVKHSEMLAHYPQDMSHATVLLGVGETNVVHDLSFDDYPHWLIAGASRSGKSNMLNNILSGLIRFVPHTELQFVMVDPKKVELSYYEALPHLARPVLYGIEEAIEMLNEVNAQIDERTDRMKSRAKNLADFNARFPKEKMTRLIVVIEEMASLMTTKKKGEEVKTLLARIAAMGRGCGIHLILCTQLPIVEVIPSLIRVNMWVRIAGRVQNHIESSVILGSTDAARLPKIRGRMVYGADAEKFYIQTPLVTDDDVHEAVAIARGRAAGLIRLAGYQPVIQPGTLMVWVAQHPEIKGHISARKLANALRDYGISQKMIEAWIDDLVAAGGGVHEGKTFEIFTVGKIRWLKLIHQEYSPAPSVAQLPSRPAPLMLPSRPAPLLLPATATPPSDWEIFQIYKMKTLKVAPERSVRIEMLRDSYVSWCYIWDHEPGDLKALVKRAGWTIKGKTVWGAGF